MANDGTMHVDKMKKYEDLESLKKHINSGESKWDLTTKNEIHRHLIQLSTGTAAEIENTDAIAISQIGRTGVTLELSAAADEASHNTVVFSLTWEDNAGTSYTSEATGTAGLNTTPVAFATPVATTVYKVTAFTASADFDNQDVYAMINGSSVYATITAAGAVLAATEAQMHGVGSVYVRSHTNHNDADGAIIFGEYLTGAGTINYMHGTIPDADGTVETRFFEATVAAGVYTATTTTVKDFYRVRTLYTDTAPTANSHEYFVCDGDLGNVDGSGGDAYAVMLEGSTQWATSRYTPPKQYDAWVAFVHGNCTQALQGILIESIIIINRTRDK